MWGDAPPEIKPPPNLGDDARRILKSNVDPTLGHRGGGTCTCDDTKPDATCLEVSGLQQVMAIVPETDHTSDNRNPLVSLSSLPHPPNLFGNRNITIPSNRPAENNIAMNTEIRTIVAKPLTKSGRNQKQFDANNTTTTPFVDNDINATVLT